MKRIRILHRTEYHYHEPVTFGPHRAMLRPLEGHDVHIEDLTLSVEPTAAVRWVRDIYGNSLALLNFEGPASCLAIESNVLVDLYGDDFFETIIDPDAKSYPFQYAPNEQMELLLYRVPSYPHDGPALRTWLRELYRPGQLIDTFELLSALNTRIFESLRYENRNDPGVRLPCETLALGAGSCRDYAVLMMEAARHWGFGARFVTGYIQLQEGQHGATHAWTEVYLPGAGWRGFDPTNNKLVGNEHIAVAVSCEQEKAMPLSGTWSGPAEAFDRMEVSVQVVAI